jgi:hypothetical protein
MLARCGRVRGGDSATKYPGEKMVDEEGVEDDDSEELPSIEEFLLKDGLYRERHLLGDGSFVRRLQGGPDIQFDAYCTKCKMMSTFREKATRSGGAGMRSPTDERYLKDDIFSLVLFCQRNEKHKYFYVIEVERQAIQKIGQSPSMADIAFPQIEMYKSVLDESYLRELKSAMGLFAHGVGIGSFTYLRRVFEKLIIDERDAERASGKPLVGFEELPLDQKIDALKDRLPSALLKYKLIYGVLSVGLHQLDEQKCLAYFPVVQAIIFLILDDHIDVRNKKLAQEKVDREFNEIHAKLKKEKKT